MRDFGETLFRALTLGVCALLLVGSLLFAPRMTALNDRVNQSRAAVEELQRENRRLSVRAACALNLRELERFALEELGMQPLSAEQIIPVKEPVE